MPHSVTHMTDASVKGGATVGEPPLQRTALLELAESVASFGHWQIDLKEGRLFWSDQVFRIHGVARDEYAPDIDSAIDFYHPDDAARVASMLDSAISDRRPFEFEFRIIRPDGAQRIVQSRARVEVDENDTVVSVFGVVRDVTREREAQRRLEQQVERFDLAMQGAGVGLWDWDFDSDAVHLSERGARLTGLGTTCTGEAFLQSVVAQDQVRVREALEAHIDRRVPFDVECRVGLRNRQIKWLRMCGQALWDRHGKVQRVAGSLQDVSQSKRHQALREAITELGATQGLSSEHRVGRLLGLGYRFLGLDFAMVVTTDAKGVIVSHVDDQSGRVRQGTRVGADVDAVRRALSSASVITDCDEVLRNLVPVDAAGPHGAGDMIGAPLRIGRQPQALVVFAGAASSGRIFGETARSVVSVLAQVIGYELACADQAVESFS